MPLPARLLMTGLRLCHLCGTSMSLRLFAWPVQPHYVAFVYSGSGPGGALSAARLHRGC